MFWTIPALLAAFAGACKHSIQPGGEEDIGMPLEMRLILDEDSISLGALEVVRLELRALRSLRIESMRAWTSGSVQFTRDPSFDLTYLGGDESAVFVLPVRYLSEGMSGVFVEVEAVIADLDFKFSKRAVLNAYLRSDRAFAGMEDPSNLERRALDYDVRTGRVSAEEAEESLRQINTFESVPGYPVQRFQPLQWSEGEPVLSPAPPHMQSDDEANPEDGTEGTTATNVTVFGTVQYLDETNTAHPVYGFTVEIWDDDIDPDDFIDSTFTATDGTYSITFDFTDISGPDVYARFRPVNSLIEVRPLGGGVYFSDSAVTNDVSSDTMIEYNLTCAPTGDGPVGSVCSGMSFIGVYVRDDLLARSLLGGGGGQGLLLIPVEFPGSPGAFYNGTLINLSPDDRFDWDVMHHEYGHYAQDSLNFENNPGGAHVLGDCLSDTHANKSHGIRLAWGEGWATFFGTSGQAELGLGAVQAPRVGDPVYADTVDGMGGFSYSLETNSGCGGDSLGKGEDNEVAVQRLLWDLYDANADNRDSVTRSDNALFDRFKLTNIDSLSQAWALVRFPSPIAANTIEDILISAVTSDHGIGPALLLGPIDGADLQEGTELTWTVGSGCTDPYGGDQFTLRFYNGLNFSQILAIGPLNADSHTLTAGEAATLSPHGVNLRWAVDSTDTINPVTGPYLGENVGSSPFAFYCSGKTTSAGCVPFLSYDGLPSPTSRDPFNVFSNNHIESELGFFFYSFKKNSLDFHGGKLCVKPPVQRLSSLIKTTDGLPCTDCAGNCRMFKRNFNQLIQGGIDPMLSCGQAVFVQFQQRDPANAIPTGFGDNLSGGLRFTIQP